MYLVINNKEEYSKWIADRGENAPNIYWKGKNTLNYPFTVFWHEVPFEYEMIDGDLSLKAAQEKAEGEGREVLTKARTYIPGLGVTFKVMNIFGRPVLQIDSRRIDNPNRLDSNNSWSMGVSKEILLDLAMTFIQAANAEYNDKEDKLAK